MLDNTAETTVSADTWIAQVSEKICTMWGEQAFQRPKHRARRIKALVERRNDFDVRVAAVANLIDAVTPRLTKRGELTDAEYKLFLLVPLHAQLPFLQASVRADLARVLIALHAAKC